MEKPARKESLILLVSAGLIVFAWLCRVFDIPWEGGSNHFRSVIYPVLYIFWGFTLHRRLIHPQVRHLAVSIAVLTVFWFLVRTVKFSLPDQLIDLTRYLWYLYYLPMIFIPLLALLAALTIGMPEGKRLPGKCVWLWLSAGALFLLVITNDLHELVFVFPDNLPVRTDHDYSYGFVYYVVSAWEMVSNLVAFLILIVKSRFPGGHYRVFIPGIPLFLLLCYWVLYILRVGWFRVLFGDMTAACCLLYVLTLELCIRCNLIRSNSGYRELFRAGCLGAQIADRSYQICLSGADASHLTKEEIIGAEEGLFLPDKGAFLHSRPIRFGHVLWQEDVSALTEAIEDFEENCRELTEHSRIDREYLEAEKKLLVLQEKNRTEDLLHRETGRQFSYIDSLLTRYDAENDEKLRRRYLAGAAVVGAYIKRYGNLLLTAEEHTEADAADLARCFEESFLSLELLDVNCLCRIPRELLLKTEDMLLAYRVFEEILEDCLFDLQDIWVQGREKDGRFVLNMEFVCQTDLSRHAQKVDAFSFDAWTSRFSISLRKGGEAE